MKKLVPFALAAALAFPSLAEEVADLAEMKTADAKAEAADRDREYAVWPAFVALYEWPETPELVGIRFSIPWSTKQESVTGIDVGFYGRCQNFEGLAVNVIANSVKDSATGIQIGLGNFADQMNMFGIQVGLWNESRGIDGFQVGLANVAGNVNGFQIGVVNRCETMRGYQVGVINVIRDAELRFMPVVNIGF